MTDEDHRRLGEFVEVAYRVIWRGVVVYLVTVGLITLLLRCTS